jgi:hypothetical protein
MAMHLLDLSPTELAQVRELISANRFGSVEEFLQTAVRNQLLLERHGNALGSSIPEESPQNVRHRKWSVTAVPGETVTVSADEQEPPQGPLFGQFYRFLPLKFVLRFVAAKTTLGPASLADLEEELGKEGTHLALQLRAVQAGDLALSTGFPSDDRDSRKSRERFTTQYLGRVSSSGAVSGFGAAMGFLGAVPDYDKIEVRVALTKAGLDFVRIPNPILDGSGSDPLSVEEVAFLLRKIAERLPDEHEHLQETIRAVRSGSNAPTSLAEAMGDFYRRRFGGGDWSQAKVNLTKAGAVSRLSEMKLLKPIKAGSKVTYEPALISENAFTRD